MQAYLAPPSCGTPAYFSNFNIPYSYTPNNCIPGSRTPQTPAGNCTSPFSCCSPKCCIPECQMCSPSPRCRRPRRSYPRKFRNRNVISPVATKRAPSNSGINLNPSDLRTSSSMRFVESQVGVTQHEGGRVGAGQVTQSCTILDVAPGCDEEDVLPVHSSRGACTPRSHAFSRSPSPSPLRQLNQVSGCSAVQCLCKSPPPRPPPPCFHWNCRLPCQGPPPRPPPPMPCGRKPPCIRPPTPCIAVGRHLKNSCCCSPMCCIPTSLGSSGCQQIMFTIGKDGCCYPCTQQSSCPQTLYLIEKSFRVPTCSNQPSCYPLTAPSSNQYPLPQPATYRPPPPGAYFPPTPSPPGKFYPPPSPFGTTPMFLNPQQTPWNLSPAPFLPARTSFTHPPFPGFNNPSIGLDAPSISYFGVGTPPSNVPSTCCKHLPTDRSCCFRPSQTDTCCSRKPRKSDNSTTGPSKSRYRLQPKPSCSRSNCSLSPSTRPPWGSRSPTPCNSGSCGRPRMPTPTLDLNRPSQASIRPDRPPHPILSKFRRTPSYDPYYNRSPSKDPYSGTSQDPYSRTSPQDPYFTKSSQYRYSRTSPQKPYPRTSPSQDPYSRTSPQDPYSRTSPSQDPYSRTSPSQDPYSRTSPQDPYSIAAPSNGLYSRTILSNGPYSRTILSNGPYSRTSPSHDPYSRTSPSNDPQSRTSSPSNPCNQPPSSDPCCRNPCEDLLCCPLIPKPCPPACCNPCPNSCVPCPPPVICCCPCKKKKKRYCPPPEEKRFFVKQCFNTCPICDPCECIRQNESSQNCCSFQNSLNYNNCSIPYRNYTYCTTTLN